MIRFVYPNVNDYDQFSGCGRFITTSPKDPILKKKYEIAAPNVGHLSKIMKAIALLAKNSSESTQQVYEYKDEHTSPYVGDSIGLAYLMACIMRSQQTIWDNEAKSFDIWCTGVIEVIDDRPITKNTYQNLFDIKLKAFIVNKTDNLFILPFANINSRHEKILQEHEIRIFFIDQFSTISIQELLKRKTILVIHEKELVQLVRTIFVQPPLPNPYRGLSPFQEDDANLFFGREQVIRVLWDKLCILYERPPDRSVPLRLLTILGPSGSGKSSVARAGLLPKLAKHPLPGKQYTRVVVLTPGTHPLNMLAVSLAHMATNDSMPAVKKSREFTNKLCQADGLLNIARILPDIDTHPLILLIDQFEEIYSLCQDAEERRLMIENLLHAAADPSGHVSVILTLRTDFLGHTQSHPELNHTIATQGIIVPVMNNEELREAIAKPAELTGHPLDAATIDLLIAQSAGREGVLPLLQFALTRIWEGLLDGIAPAETLNAIGGVGGALAGEAQRLYDKLTDTDKMIARRAFLALVQLGEGTQDMRRRAAVLEITAHGEDPRHVSDVLRVFAQPSARLVTLSVEPQTDNVIAEITHEALLSHWTSLKEWLDNSRDDLRFHRRLAEAANHWKERNQPEGLLWRSPDLDLLYNFYTRTGSDMTSTQMQFFNASVRREKHSKRLKSWMITILLIFMITTSIAAYLAIQSRKEALRLYYVSIVQSLVTYADQYFLRGDREQAALLARQTYFLNDTYQGNIDEQIRDVLRRTLALPEEETVDLIERVCQQARRNLTPDEWKKVIKSEDISYKPCSGLPNSDGAAELVLRLRSEPMFTEERQHLSLYVKADGYVGTFLDNRFEIQEEGMVIVDHATGLMWQQSGSEENVTYEEAQQYVKQLNTNKFAGYDNWQLPTVEELVSLVEPEKKNNDLYIAPIFNAKQSRCWSADKLIREGGLAVTWGIYFDGGNVGWSNLDFKVFVRAVRS